MKPVPICLLPLVFTGMVCFSQDGNSSKDSTIIKFPPRHFTNHLATHKRIVADPAIPLSLRNLPTVDGRSSFMSGTPYLDANSWRQQEPLWKVIVGLAGKMALSVYADNYNLYQHQPPQHR